MPRSSTPSPRPARGQKRSLRSAKGQETNPRPFGHRPCVNSFRWTLRATWVTACVAAAALGLLLGPGARASESLTRSTKGDTNAASIMGAAFCVGPVCVSPRAPLASRIFLGAEEGGVPSVPCLNQEPSVAVAGYLSYFSASSCQLVLRLLATQPPASEFRMNSQRCRRRWVHGCARVVAPWLQADGPRFQRNHPDRIVVDLQAGGAGSPRFC